MWPDLSEDLNRDYFGYLNNLKIRGSARVYRQRSSANIVQNIKIMSQHNLIYAAPLIIFESNRSTC